MEYIFELLSTVGPFFILLGFLIFFHELGHFAVARYFGVRVEIFSIGFGKTLVKYKHGDTEYRLSLFPLGGYVKMYGDNPTAEVPEDQQAYSFFHKPVWPRIAIVLAGPLANLILALFIFFVIGITGETQIAAQLGDIKENTPAYDAGLRSGDKVLKVNDKDIKSYEQLESAIALYPDQEVTIKVLRDGDELDVVAKTELRDNPNILSTKVLTPQIEGVSIYSNAAQIGFSGDSIWAQAGLKPLDKITQINDKPVENFRSLNKVIAGLTDGDELKIQVSRMTNDPKNPEALSFDATYDSNNSAFESTELYLGQVQANSPAEKAGLKRGDKITHINGNEIVAWDNLLEIVKNYNEDQGALNIQYLRDFNEHQIEVVPLMKSLMNAKAQEEKRPIIGIVPGIFVQIPEQVSVPAGGVLASVGYSANQTYKWTIWTINSIKKVVVGEVSHKNLGGLFTIGQVASQSFKVSWTYFLQMMGIISINLFLLNLIPIPVLDGGHLLFYTIEALRGKPVSPQKMEVAFFFGFVVLVSLMGFTLFNDVQRIFFSGW